MSVLVDRDIIEAMGRGEIAVDPFDPACLGTNSYDVHLAPVLRTYVRGRDIPRDFLGEPHWGHRLPIDMAADTPTEDVRIPDAGLVLEPGRLYLASTVEYTESHAHVPVLNGRSSVGRLGLSIHVTAGTGDVGFCGHWTMEMFVIEPLRVYPGVAIGQILWLAASGRPDFTYRTKNAAKYNKGGPLPQPSRLHVELAQGSGRRG